MKVEWPNMPVLSHSRTVGGSRAACSTCEQSCQSPDPEVNEEWWRSHAAGPIDLRSNRENKERPSVKAKTLDGTMADVASRKPTKSKKSTKAAPAMGRLL